MHRHESYNVMDSPGRIPESNKPALSTAVEGMAFQFVDLSVLPAGVIDTDRHWLHTNSALDSLMGSGARKLVGDSLDANIHREERARIQRDLRLLRLGEREKIRTECRLIQADGTALKVSITIMALPVAAADHRQVYLAQFADIADRRAPQDSPADAERRYGHALEGSGQVVWDLDIATGTVRVSPQWQKLLDLPDLEEIRPISRWLDKTHADDRQRLAEAIEQARCGAATTLDVSYRLRHHTRGEWIWVLSRGRAVEHMPDGSARRMIGTIIDLTREKELEARLAATNKRLEIALGAGKIGIFEIDFVTRTRSWDARTHELHGVTPETFDGSPERFAQLLHPDDVARMNTIREKAFAEESDYRGDYRVIHSVTAEVRHIRFSIHFVRTAGDRVPRCIGACWDITEDVERTARLRGTLALVEAFLKSTPDLVYVKDRDGRYLLINESVEKLMGHTSADVLGKDDTDIFPPELAQALLTNDRLILASGQSHTFEETPIVDGMQRSYSSTKAPLRDAQGAIIGILGISRDLTEIKKAEAELQRSEARWQFAIEGARDGIWDWDLATGQVFYSRQWKAMLGYKDHEIGSSASEWFDRVHPEDLSRCWAIIEQHFAGETPDFTLEHRMRCKHGQWRWILDRGKVVERYEDGRPRRVIGVQTDITRRKDEENNIRALNQRFQLAIDAAQAGIYEYDLSAARFNCDDRVYELYGIARGAIEPTVEGWLSLVHPDDVPSVMRAYKKATEESSVFDLDFRVKRPSSGHTHYVRSLARVVRDGSGKPLRSVGMIWDVTDAVEQAKALFEEKERLRVTLHSIGDGVICTDAEARVTFMNPAAERLTGWATDAAGGKRLSEVFSIIDRTTGISLPDPVESCLDPMNPFDLQNDIVLVDRSGERHSIRNSAAPVRAETGEIIGAVLVFQDITKARALQQALEYAASHDNMTGLMNRTAFEQGLRGAAEQAREERREHVLAFVDLDKFKIVNDTVGHAAGDAMLCDIANILRRHGRANDLTARLGGDEFALLLRDCTLDEGEIIARQFQHDVSELQFTWNSRVYHAGASIGLARIGPNAPAVHDLMIQADTACYAAKTAGRSQISVYYAGSGDAQRHHREIQIAASIRESIENDRFRLFAQEIRSLKNESSDRRHYEILLRMVDEDKNLIDPAGFIPAAERYDLMGTVDRWVIRTVLRTYGPRLKAAPDITVAINLSANSLNDPLLWPFVHDELQHSKLEPQRLHFEITETAVVNNYAAAHHFLSMVRNAGCGVMLDDFGVGQSSFAYLRQFVVDRVKIDGVFIRQMMSSKIDRAIVESINAIGHRVGATTVAEHVEDTDTLEELRKMGVDEVQGFAIARPQPLDFILDTFDAQPRPKALRVQMG